VANMKYVTKGMNETREGLLQQGRVSLGLIAAHHDELHACGWNDDWTTVLQRCVDELGTKMSAQADAKGQAKVATKKEAHARTAVKAMVRKLKNAVPPALRAAPNSGVTLEAFFIGDKLGQATPKIMAYVEKILPLVEKIDKQLKPYFGGESAHEQLRSVKQDLGTTDTDQEVKASSLPQETMAVYELKGRLLEAVEDLNRVARIAFDGQAEMAGRFNKDILLRSRRTRSKKAAPAGVDDNAGGAAQ